jgi:hypothetical protein
MNLKCRSLAMKILTIYHQSMFEDLQAEGALIVTRAVATKIKGVTTGEIVATRRRVMSRKG